MTYASIWAWRSVSPKGGARGTYAISREVELGLVGIIKTVIEEELVDTEVTACQTR
jgi:hypothetical protein